MSDKPTATEVRQAVEPPPMCDYETVLACERMLHDTVQNLCRNIPLSEWTESEKYIVAVLQRDFETAKAGYYELQKRLRSESA